MGASKRGCAGSTLRERRVVGLARFMHAALSRDALLVIQAAFDRWADDVFRKDQQELWGMHVAYLHKQSDLAAKRQSKLCNRYGGILDGLLRRGEWQCDVALVMR